MIIYIADWPNQVKKNVNEFIDHKIYKTIKSYSNIVLDKNCKILDLSKYPKFLTGTNRVKITEDTVTSFFETLLMEQKIIPLYMNAPGTSWSEVKLLPTNKIIYYERNAKRPDICYMKDNIYYIGESKSEIKKFKQEKVLEVIDSFQHLLFDELGHQILAKNFCIFYSTYVHDDIPYNLKLKIDKFNIKMILSENKDSDSILLEVV